MLTRDTLIDRVWGPRVRRGHQALDVHIKRLRARDDTEPRSPASTVTIRGLGYTFALLG